DRVGIAEELRLARDQLLQVAGGGAQVACEAAELAGREQRRGGGEPRLGDRVGRRQLAERGGEAAREAARGRQRLRERREAGARLRERAGQQRDRLAQLRGAGGERAQRRVEVRDEALQR